MEWQRRVAALQLVVAEEPASRWDQALVPGQDISTLGQDGYFGYVVDGGVGTFADPIALRALSEWDWDRVNAEFLNLPWPSAPVPGLRAVVTDEHSGGTSSSCRPKRPGLAW